MRLSDMQNKDIINITDGKKIGNLIDAEIDSSGKIKKIIIEPSKALRKVLSAKDEVEVMFESIVKIGTDVILVEEVK